jgi:hypothetical protein
MILVGSALAATLLISVSSQAASHTSAAGYADTPDMSTLLARRSADDGPNHDVNDDRGRGRGGRNRGYSDEVGHDAAVLARRGADDGPNHDVGDDRGRGRGGRNRGYSDEVRHDAAQLARRGADDGPNHDVGDDRGRGRGGRG